MPRRIDPYDVISKLLVKASKADERAEFRIERLWQAIFSATYASDVHPLDQLVAVLWMLEQAGHKTPALNAKQMVDKYYAAKVGQGLTAADPLWYTRRTSPRR